MRPVFSRAAVYWAGLKGAPPLPDFLSAWAGGRIVSSSAILARQIRRCDNMMDVEPRSRVAASARSPG
jgi:hypothetical protein